MHRQRGKGDLRGSRNAFQALAHHGQRVFGREEQHRSAAPHRELAQTGSARSDADRHIQSQEAFAAFRFPAQDADGLLGPEILDQPLGLRAAAGQLAGPLNRATLETFQTAAMMKRTLRAGFTTIREPGIANDVGLRLAVEEGLVEGPRMVMAAGLGQIGGHLDDYYPRGLRVPLYRGVEICSGVAEVQRATRMALAQGFDFIKVCATGGVASPADSPDYTEWTLEELKTIVGEATARGKAVMAHAEGSQGIKNAIRAGVWSVEHGSILDDEAIEMLLAAGTYLVPTLFIAEEIFAHGKEMGLSDVAMAKIKTIKAVHAESFAKAAAAGVKIAVGSDAIDASMHGKNARELEYMVRHGLTPMQAIVAATKTSSEACRVSDRVGVIEPGKLADMLVIDGDPLADIRILQEAARLLLVMKEGTTYVDGLRGPATT